MAYTDQATLAIDATFKTKIQVAVVTNALAVATSAAGTGDLAGGRRQALALGVLNNPATYVDRFAWMVACTSGITSGSTDAAILAAVVAGWDEMAGVTAVELVVMRDTFLRDRIRAAMMRKALTLAGSAQGALSSAVYGKEQALAYAILTNAEQQLDRFVWALCSTGTTTVSTNDATLVTNITAIFDDMAGVTALD